METIIVTGLIVLGIIVFGQFYLKKLRKLYDQELSEKKDSAENDAAAKPQWLITAEGAKPFVAYDQHRTRAIMVFVALAAITIIIGASVYFF